MGIRSMHAFEAQTDSGSDANTGEDKAGASDDIQHSYTVTGGVRLATNFCAICAACCNLCYSCCEQLSGAVDCSVFCLHSSVCLRITEYFCADRKRTAPLRRVLSVRKQKLYDFWLCF